MAGFLWASRLTVFFDADGTIPAAGHTLTFYKTGTLTLQPTYSDVALAVANANPIELDADGRLPVDVYLDPTEDAYRVIQRDPDSNIVAEDAYITAGDATAAIAAHNADPDAHLDATEGQRGMVELANSTEYDAADKALSPATALSIYFPIGSIKITTTSTNPGTYMGGTWAAFGAGRVLVGLDAGQTEFDTVLETGGSKTHTLTEAELAAHRHQAFANETASSGGDEVAPSATNSVARERTASSGDSDYNLKNKGIGGGNPTTTDSTVGRTSEVGTSTPFSILPPYIVCYFWRRTA